MSEHRYVKRPARTLTRHTNVSGSMTRIIRYTSPPWKQCERCGCSEGFIEHTGAGCLPEAEEEGP